METKRRKPSGFARFVSMLARIVAVLVLVSLLTVLLSMNKMYRSFDAVSMEIEQLVEVLGELPTGGQASRMYAGDYDAESGHGTLLATLADENRQLAEYSELPPALIACLISTEDKNFYSHSGVDYLGMGRAVMKGARRGGDIRGTSTITQQLSRNVFLKHIQFKKSYDRKMQEIILAMAVEEKFSKQQIIEAYLNHIFLGNQSYGVKSAARNYFGKSLDELTLSECALLAGLPQLPSKYDPSIEGNMPAAINRRDTVLKLLEQRIGEGFFRELERDDPEKFEGFSISREEINAAIEDPITLTTQRDRAHISAPYFTSYVRDRVLYESYGDSVVKGEGWTIVTSLDPVYQKWAEQSVKELIDKNRKSKRVSQAAVIVIDARTGAVLANVGGYEWGSLNDKGQPDNLNRAFISGRQTGSSFKPFTYATAYEQGFHPNTAVFDGPNKEATARLKKAWPKNSDGAYKGWMAIYAALQGSRNAAAVDLLVNCTGIQPVIETARRMGVTADLPEVPALTLGVANIKPIEMAGAFSTFPNMGKFVKPITIKKIYDQNGILIADYETQASIQRRSNDALSPTTAFMMVKNLRRAVTSGTGGRAQLRKGASGVEVAGKTGTTDDFTDAWFVGFSPELVCAVWVGNDDYKKRLNSVYGGGLPAEIFSSIMTKIYSQEGGRYKQKTFEKPEGVDFDGFSGGSQGSGGVSTEEAPAAGAEGAAADGTGGEGGGEEGGGGGGGDDNGFYDPWQPGDDGQVYF